MPSYIVEVACMFDDMDDARDAVGAMAAWLSTDSYKAAYRVTDIDTGVELFVDAELLNFP